MSPTAYVWVCILGVSLTTVITRASFIVLGSRVRLPAIVDHALGYAPACALAAIMVPDLAFVHGTLELNAGNPRLVGAIAAAVAFAATRSLVATIIVGMAAFTALRLWL